MCSQVVFWNSNVKPCPPSKQQLRGLNSALIDHVVRPDTTQCLHE
jgi:hypothetical protein